MSRFLKLVRIQNGSWQALPSDIDDHAPLTLTRNENAPIDPVQLLNALANLLSPDGGIKSDDEVSRLSSLMKKFSKKLVSRCVYCNVLRATKSDILDVFLLESGWNTINNWLQDAKDSGNSPFLIELLQLCKALPMTVERLKQNNTARLIKSLTKFDSDEVRELSWELVKKWMTIVKGETSENADKKKKKKGKVLNDKEQRDPKDVDTVKSPTNEPAKVRTSGKRGSKDEATKTDIYEDVKIDPEPLVKKPRIERPKTVKLFNRNFRATGLEEETPLPKNVTKKIPTVDKTVAVAVAKTAAVKRLNSFVPERIIEKKLKPEILLNAVENSNTTGGIKLIAAKPRLSHVLQESASFIDALVAPPPPPQKRKKKVPVIKSPTATTPPSPTLTPPKFQFYKETLGVDESGEENSPSKDASRNENDDEGKDVDFSVVKEDLEDISERTGSPLACDENLVQMEENIDNEIKKEAKVDQGDKSAVDTKSDPNKLCSILSHGKRREKKKTVRFQDDDNIKEIFYFDLDETERTNVSHGQKFGDLKSIEIKREREAFEAVKRLAGDKMEEVIPWWNEPIYIQLPPPLVDPGCNSKEREIQGFRQQSILQEIYFTRDMVPESPCEPDLEICTSQEPKCIPLDDENHMGTIMDYSNAEMPTPKASLPEVLTSLINIPSRRVPQPSHIPEQVPVENVLRSQPHLPLPVPSPFEPEPMVSSGLLGVAPPSHMFNGPLTPENENCSSSSDWRPMEPMSMNHGDPYQSNYGMNRPIVIDHMHQQLHNRSDMRSRMNGPMMAPDMYHPSMGKGSHMTRPMGPPRGRQRTIPCRHFSAGGCRFGANCNFLHPGVNGPLL